MMTEEKAEDVARKTQKLRSLGKQNVLGLGMCSSVRERERERRDGRSETSPSMASHVKDLLSVNKANPQWLG